MSKTVAKTTILLVLFFIFIYISTNQLLPFKFTY